MSTPTLFPPHELPNSHVGPGPWQRVVNIHSLSCAGVDGLVGLKQFLSREESRRIMQGMMAVGMCNAELVELHMK